MATSRWLKFTSFAVLFALLTACGQKVEQKVAEVAKAPEGLVKEKEAQENGIEAYIYAYPLVTMELTRQRLTNSAEPGPATAPMGQLLKLRTYPPVDNHSVTAPNADTLYTTAWLDVSKEPWIFSIPDMGDRYFLMPMLDGWTDVFQVPGKRTTGGKAQKYAITGPGWAGTLPAGVTEYKSPTGMVWILGRIYCTGTPQDYAAVHALQDKFSLVPLSAYGKAYKPEPGQVNPNLDTKTAVRDQVNAMDAASYFGLFAQLLKTNPPAADDAPMVATLAKIGIVPGQDFDASKLDPAVAKGMVDVPKKANEKIMAWMKEGILAGDMKLTDGWLFTTKTEQSFWDVKFEDGDGLLFGNEGDGSPPWLHESIGEAWRVTIPHANTELRSLNLSTAAGIACYEALRQTGFKG